MFGRKAKARKDLNRILAGIRWARNVVVIDLSPGACCDECAQTPALHHCGDPDCEPNGNGGCL